MLAANAGGIPPGTGTCPPDIGTEVRRRKVRRAGVAVLAAAVVVGGGVRLVASRSQDDQTMVVSQPTVTSIAPSPPSTAVDATSSVEMVVSGRLVRFAPAPVDHGTLPGEAHLAQDPPVRTPFGVVASLGSSVWLVPDRGQPAELATGARADLRRGRGRRRETGRMVGAAPATGIYLPARLGRSPGRHSPRVSSNLGESPGRRVCR